VVDSQSLKSTAVGGEERGYDGGKKVKGRKPHLLVETEGFVLKAKVMSAKVMDYEGIKTLLREADRIFLDLHRFRGLFQTENSARKGEQCHEQTRPIPRSFAEKLSGWLEPPMKSIPSPGSLARSVSPMAP
jgi:hypothetical protein